MSGCKAGLQTFHFRTRPALSVDTQGRPDTGSFLIVPNTESSEYCIGLNSRLSQASVKFLGCLPSQYGKSTAGPFTESVRRPPVALNSRTGATCQWSAGYDQGQQCQPNLLSVPAPKKNVAPLITRIKSANVSETVVAMFKGPNLS